VAEARLVAYRSRLMMSPIDANVTDEGIAHRAKDCHRTSEVQSATQFIYIKSLLNRR
jgi:hypothetical protein